MLMDARTRYLAVYNDSQRKRLDRVPTHVQYVREEFISKHKKELVYNYKGIIFNNKYFDIPLILGFDSVFASFPSIVKIKSVKVQGKERKEIRIGADGQKLKKNSTYYQGGYIHDIDILEELRSNLSIVDRSKQINKLINYYEKIAPYIFPVLIVDGIFDKVWKSMGIVKFSENFKKNSADYDYSIQYTEA